MRLRSIARFAYHHSSPGKILRSLRYPGIRMAADVRLDIRGRLAYGRDCTIGARSILMVRDGSSLSFGHGCALGRSVELGPAQRIDIGNETSIQDRSILLGDVALGAYCSLAPNVYISSGRHWFSLAPHELIKDQDRLVAGDVRMSEQHSRPVKVEDDCWLGINTVVSAGVTIGKGCVVGANSVVTKDVEPYSVIAGAPARLLRKRLEFAPPQLIDAARAEDRPYFYGGFDVSRQQTRDLPATGGIAAHGAFVLALNTATGNSLRMVIRAADRDTATLSLGEDQASLSAVYSEIAFKLTEPRAYRLRLEARGAGGSAKIFLQKAWIE